MALSQSLFQPQNFPYCVDLCLHSFVARSKNIAVSGGDGGGVGGCHLLEGMVVVVAVAAVVVLHVVDCRLLAAQQQGPLFFVSLLLCSSKDHAHSPVPLGVS